MKSDYWVKKLVKTRKGKDFEEIAKLGDKRSVFGGEEGGVEGRGESKTDGKQGSCLSLF